MKIDLTQALVNAIEDQMELAPSRTYESFDLIHIMEGEYLSYEGRPVCMVRDSLGKGNLTGYELITYYY